jgi:hypothetical protein
MARQQQGIDDGAADARSPAGHKYRLLIRHCITSLSPIRER